MSVIAHILEFQKKKIIMKIFLKVTFILKICLFMYFKYLLQIMAIFNSYNYDKVLIIF